MHSILSENATTMSFITLLILQSHPNTYLAENGPGHSKKIPQQSRLNRFFNFNMNLLSQIIAAANQMLLCKLFS